MAGTNGASNGASNSNGAAVAKIGTSKVKQGLAQMLKGGVIVSLILILVGGGGGSVFSRCLAL